jgi:hypothetical protein
MAVLKEMNINDFREKRLNSAGVAVSRSEIDYW